jgi:YD repeat-containing protein
MNPITQYAYDGFGNVITQRLAPRNPPRNGM